MATEAASPSDSAPWPLQYRVTEWWALLSKETPELLTFLDRMSVPYLTTPLQDPLLPTLAYL